MHTRRTLLSLLATALAAAFLVATTPMRDPPLRSTDATDATDAPAASKRLPRPLRGVWMASVEGLDLPPPGLPPAALEAGLRQRVAWADEAGMNAIFVQVRAEGDTLYASPTEPWSRSLTGEQGGDPGVDPLAILLDEAHGRGMQIHAWINPFRAAADRTKRLAPSHIAHRRPDLAVAHGPHLWLDPAHPHVQAHVRGVIADLADRYDIDGVHLDDYFYPYPIRGQAFADGGRSAEARQAAIDTFIADLSAQVRGRGLPLTISPFGLHPEQPGFSGFDPVAGLHADPLTWSRAGQLDALVPQVYWPTTDERRPHTRLATWWCEQGGAHGTTVAIGHAMHPVVEGRWPAEELVAQAAARPEHCPGAIWFRLAYLEDPALRALFRDRIHREEAPATSGSP